MRHFVSIAAIALLVLGSVSAVGVTAQENSLLDLLPGAADIGPAFVAVERRDRSLDEQATGFADAGEAARLLAGWDWQANAFAVFQSADAPPTTFDISLTRFATPTGAATALPYFLDDRAAMLGQTEVQLLSESRVGDEMRAVEGEVEGGFDTTLYVRSGALLIRVSATSPSGDATISPDAIARGIVARAAPQAPPNTTLQLAADALPETLPLDDADCFSVAGEGALDVPAVVERLAGIADGAVTLEKLGWEGGVYRQFTCDPPPGRAGWIDISLHRFADAALAADAVAVFAAARERGSRLQPAAAPELGERTAALTGPGVNGTEYTLYVSSGPVLFAITGVAPDGDPRADVEETAAALVASPVPASPAAVPTSTPYTLGAPAATAPTPTSTPLPTPIPPPTATPLPTATPVPPTPLPTATPAPTAVPALIPVAIPTTAPPQPTATTGPLPTPTPRVIRPPTPAAG